MDKKSDIKKLILKDIYECSFIKILDEFCLDEIAKHLNNGKKLICVELLCQDKISINIALKIRQLCSFYDSLFFIKKRCDIAKLVNSDGIYLDNNDIDIIYAKKILDNDIIFATNYKNILNSPECIENIFDIVFIEKDDKQPLKLNLDSLKSKIIYIE